MASAIDPLINLRQRHLYVFSGTDDKFVRQPAVDATVSFFLQLGVKKNLQYVNPVPAGHAHSKPDDGNDCAANAAPDRSMAAGTHCKVHVAIHGCVQAAESVGSRFYAHAGYNNWADNNHILVLYPQVNKSENPSSPQGCWDWWGYTGQNYAYRSGPQMKAIKAMVDRLTQHP